MDGMIAKPAELAPAPGDPARLECFIPTPCVQNHAGFIAPLPGGDLGCVWFGGTQEGIPDISVHFSRLPAGATRWTEAEKLSDDPTRSEQNPLLFNAPDGTLWVLWTAQTGGNQDTAMVRRRISRDGGLSWGAIETLIPAFGPYKFAKARTIFNGRVALRDIRVGPVNAEVALWGRNLSNNKDVLYQLQFGDFELNSSYQPARTYGVDFIFKL